MSSPFRVYRTFIDAHGVRWGVEARVLGEGADAIPIGFAFVSQYGERRMFDGYAPEGLALDQFLDAEWSELLLASRRVRVAPSRPTRPPQRGATQLRRWLRST
jgi:hypothetical protein